MSNSFITSETEKSIKNTFSLNVRLFQNLPLFRKLIPLSVILILLSSAGPSLYRWYSGKYSVGEIGFTLSGLLWFVFFGVLFRIGAWMSFELSGMWASQSIHRDMIRALSKTRTTYFDENPSGRLINRLIRDYDEVRSTGIIFVGDLFNAVIEVSAVAVLAALANPWAGLLILPLLGSFFYIQYNRSAMIAHARLLSAVASGQVLARQSDLIEGREIFLLYGKSKKLLSRMSESFRNYTHASMLGSSIEAWGSFWIRFSTEVFSLAVLILTTLALHYGRVDAALTGVIISSLFGITGSIGWLDFATSLISRSVPHIERVFELVDLPSEEKEERLSAQAGPLVSISPTQPQDIHFKNYSMSYRKDSPLILSNLNLTLPAGKRIALIGRTGSGKTSLTQALLRMVYVQSGEIYLNDQSVFQMKVSDLRKQFGVIPQAPYLFQGTLKSNLDLTQTLGEAVLQKALDTVGLPYSLDHEVSEGGMNLSQGERQLICLARVIAADKPYIIMDEATSGLDPETDAKMTQILKRELSGKTILTIAHRMETIYHYDWFVELAEGKLIRQGLPSDL